MLRKLLNNVVPEKTDFVSFSFRYDSWTYHEVQEVTFFYDDLAVVWWHYKVVLTALVEDLEIVRKQVFFAGGEQQPLGAN